MTTLKQAAQLALDYIRSTTDYKMGHPPACEAAVDLADALENQFNPDWDQVEALQESLREHMAEIQRLRTALAKPKPRNQCAETCERAKLCAVCLATMDDAMLKER
jgi:hypothetical protein